MQTVTERPAPAAAGATRASYARATMHTAAVLADPSASLMDRMRAAEAEEAACLAAREAEADLEAEAGL
jgi:hypothetical protein